MAGLPNVDLASQGFGRAHAVPAGRVAGRRIAGKPIRTQRNSLRAGRPRSRVGLLPSLLNHKRAPGCRAAARPMRQSRRYGVLHGRNLGFAAVAVQPGGTPPSSTPPTGPASFPEAVRYFLAGR